MKEFFEKPRRNASGILRGENKIVLAIVVGAVIMGEVKEYQGRPEIILETPNQIEIGK